MSGVLKKTSIVLLLCISIAFKLGCTQCKDGYKSSWSGGACTKIKSGADCKVEHCADCTFMINPNVCVECEAGYDKEESPAEDKCKKGNCFPGSAMVTTPRGSVAMETLNIGDNVLTEMDNNQLGFTKVVGFAQREPGTHGYYLSITAVNQAGHTHTVKLTATHNIYIKNKISDDDDDYIPRFAGDVLIGDMLKIQTDNGTALNAATVTHVTLYKEMGAYAPLTETGTMLVEGTLVSCYASFNDKLVHVLMAPIRWFPWFFEDEEKPLEGKLPYVEVVKYIGRNYAAPFVSLK